MSEKNINEIVRNYDRLEIDEEKNVPKTVKVKVDRGEAEEYIRNILIGTKYTIKSKNQMVPEQRHSTRFIVKEQGTIGKIRDMI